MDRETALQDYQKSVEETVLDFRGSLEAYLVDCAAYMEDMVRTGMRLLGEQMKKQGKEYVCFLYFSLLKTDLLERRYRFYLHGLDMRWYLDDEPVEVYVDAPELFVPIEKLLDALEKADKGYGGAINRYDIWNMVFDELPLFNSIICQILRYRLRDWEEKGIFDSVIRSPYWLVKWGEYRDRSEFLIQTERVEKPDTAWKEELAKAAHNPENMVFGYWYKGKCSGKSPKDLDMRFITFDECDIKDIAFENCSMEGSRFPKSKITGCSFIGCRLDGTDFRGCSFENTSFAGAVLTNAVFPAQSVPFLDIDAQQLQVIYLDRGDEA